MKRYFIWILPLICLIACDSKIRHVDIEFRDNLASKPWIMNKIASYYKSESKGKFKVGSKGYLYYEQGKHKSAQDIWDPQ